MTDRISKAIEKMIIFSEGNLHDIEHFLKVWGYAKTIGELEGLDEYTQQTLELAAIVHDIACPLCRVKYGNTAGPHQEAEGIPLAREFYEEFQLPEEQRERICYLVGHHHTFKSVEGMDYQILLEADFLVNASESRLPEKAIRSFGEKVFRTETGKRMLAEIYRI
ncbi:MAG: HD domain-containing protein [Lachnospiraceae bacterium]|nr:HD domain-containing protein [Lachnospiraceae bacterium]